MARWTGRTIIGAALVLGLAMAPCAGATTFKLDPDESTASAAVRQAAGYQYGPEGVMGVVPTGGSNFTFIASNAVSAPYGFDGLGARFTGTLSAPFASDPAGQEADDTIRMVNTPPDIHFTAPSKIYEADGYWLTIVHSERYYNNVLGQMGQQNGYYATLGLAKSTDRGATWTYLGEIIKHGTAYSTCAGLRISTEIGSGPFTIVKVGGVDYFYSYYLDKQSPLCLFRNGSDYKMLAVARAKVSDVLAAASAGRTSPWVKYDGGWGSSPGLGGTASDLNTDTNWSPGWYDVSYNTYLRKYILVSTGCEPKVQYTGSLCYRESSDGITWSPHQNLLEFPVGFNVYPTIVGLGSLPGRETGQSFYVYYLHSTASASVWLDGDLRRVKVTLTS